MTRESDKTHEVSRAWGFYKTPSGDTESATVTGKCDLNLQGKLFSSAVSRSSYQEQRPQNPQRGSIFTLLCAQEAILVCASSQQSRSETWKPTPWTHLCWYWRLVSSSLQRLSVLLGICVFRPSLQHSLPTVGIRSGWSSTQNSFHSAPQGPPQGGQAGLPSVSPGK